LLVRRGPFDRLAATASLVFIADFSTKQWALRALGSGDKPLVRGWHLTVINNTHLAGGLETGGFDLSLTAVLTIAVAALVLRICRQLASVDETAPTTLGLLVGAGAANLADAFLPPHGVVDFIAFTASRGATTSFNVADVVLALGLVLCLRTVWRIALTMRGRVFSRSSVRHAQLTGAPMRDRMLQSAGHALLAMCGFVWLYSMAIAFTPDVGRSAPNSLLCGVGVFAIVFLASQARSRLADRRLVAALRSASAHSFERVVLDGSIPATVVTELPTERSRRAPRRDIVTLDDRREPPQRSDLA
jgi:lipoprotein signal peptidase